MLVCVVHVNNDALEVDHVVIGIKWWCIAFMSYSLQCYHWMGRHHKPCGAGILEKRMGIVYMPLGHHCQYPWSAARLACFLPSAVMCVYGSPPSFMIPKHLIHCDDDCWLDPLSDCARHLPTHPVHLDDRHKWRLPWIQGNRNQLQYQCHICYPWHGDEDAPDNRKRDVNTCHMFPVSTYTYLIVNGFQHNK